jgi:hypothetical protein
MAGLNILANPFFQSTRVEKLVKKGGILSGYQAQKK